MTISRISLSVSLLAFLLPLPTAMAKEKNGSERKKFRTRKVRRRQQEVDYGDDPIMISTKDTSGSTLIQKYSSKVGKGSSKGNSKLSIQDTAGFYQTGKYIIFTEGYSDAACTSDFASFHGYPTGSCNKYFGIPETYFIIVAAQQSKDNMIFFWRFFDDPSCTSTVTSDELPGGGVSAFDRSLGCLPRGPSFYKTFRVKESIPVVDDEMIRMNTFNTEEECLDNDVALARDFMYVNPGQCIRLPKASTLISSLPGVSDDFPAATITCDENSVSVTVFNNPFCSGDPIGTVTTGDSDYCTEGTSIRGDVEGYINIKCGL